MDFAGVWYIYEMEMWDEDYFNMEVQAYIKINPNNTGDFQFGLVSCELDGRTFEHAGQKRFEFTFDGNDECEQTNGSGWIMLKEENIIEGEFRFHLSDSSTFLAKKAK